MLNITSIQQIFFIEIVGIDNKVRFNVLHSLLESKTISCHDNGWVNIILHQFVGSLEKLCSNNDNRCSSITDFLLT